VIRLVVSSTGMNCAVRRRLASGGSSGQRFGTEQPEEVVGQGDDALLLIDDVAPVVGMGVARRGVGEDSQDARPCVGLSLVVARAAGEAASAVRSCQLGELSARVSLTRVDVGQQALRMATRAATSPAQDSPPPRTGCCGADRQDRVMSRMVRASCARSFADHRRLCLPWSRQTAMPAGNGQVRPNGRDAPQPSGSKEAAISSNTARLASQSSTGAASVEREGLVPVDDCAVADVHPPVVGVARELPVGRLEVAVVDPFDADQLVAGML
jgi:hypothetical protein